MEVPPCGSQGGRWEIPYDSSPPEDRTDHVAAPHETAWLPMLPKTQEFHQGLGQL